MKTGELTMVGAGAAVAAIAFAISASPVAAQSADECRCVDRDGNEIGQCSCVRAPDVRMFGGNALYFGAERPRLGVSVDPRQSARRDAVGAMVTDVLEDGPADVAGIRRGDIIVSIDGHSLNEPLDAASEDRFDLDESVPVQRLLAITRELGVGQEVVVEYVRDDERRSATVEAEELSDAWGTRGFAPRWDSERLRERLRGMGDELRSFQYRFDWDELERDRRDRGDDVVVRRERVAPEVRIFGGDGGAFVIDRLGLGPTGLELVALNPQLGSYFGVDEGVLVAEADEDSPLGLRAGDVVVQIGERTVATPDRMRRILRSYGPDEDITLRIRRDGRDETVTGRLGR